MPATPAEWQGAVATTITDYIHGEVVEVLRNRKVLAMLENRGLVTTGHSGLNVQWNVRFLQNFMNGFDDSDTITFSNVNRHKNAVLPWRGYSLAEGMNERDRLMNKGPEAIVEKFSNLAKWMMEDIGEQLGDQVYIDGDASGNSKKFHGIESFGGVSGTVSSSKVGNPSDNYGGLNTNLGSYGGAWSGNWPDGKGDATYDFWSPLIVDYTNTLWPQTTKTWANTCVSATRWGLLASRRNKSRKKQIDVVIHDRNNYFSFVELLAVEQRGVYTPNEGSSGLWKLGFKDLQNFDGVDITWEYGPAANTGYGWCMDDVELRALTDELVTVKGPTFDEASQQHRFWAIILANMKFESIRNFLFFKAIS